MNKRTITAAKYAGTSFGLGYALTNIVTFSIPQLKPIENDLLVIVSFALNLVLARFGLLSDTDTRQE